MKTQYLIVFFVFKFSLSSHVLRNPIFDIVSRVDSKWCYQCEENCSSAIIKECSGGGRCFSKVVKTSDNKSLESKGCVETDSTEICNSNPNEEVTSCYTCEGDFCNADKRENIEDLGVSKCYVCIDECANPPDQHDCQEVLTEIEGEPVKAACLSYEIRQGEEVTVSKGCIPDDDIIRSTCALANVLYEEVTCSVCDTDLCNYVVEEEQELGVEECYYCENVCVEPLEIHNCREVLEEGSTARCLAVNASYSGQQIVYRGCVGQTDQASTLCNLANAIGGTCDICDTNLCNGITPEEGEQEEEEEEEAENYVDECYFCENTCKRPLEIHQCREILGENAKSKCFATEVVEGGVTLISKGCIEVSEEFQTTCNYINQSGGNCTVCDSNLCNGAESLTVLTYISVIVIFASRFNMI